MKTLVNNSLLILLLFLFVFLFIRSNSQNFGGCATFEDTTTTFASREGCDNLSETWLNKYRTPGFWVPDETTPIKTILVNWVICRDDNGENGWQDTQYFRDQVDLMFTHINNWYTNSLQKGYSLTCEPNYVHVVDTRIRFELNDIIFIDNTTFNNSCFAASSGIIDYIHQEYPESKNVLNHIFTQPSGSCLGGAWGYYSNISSTNTAFVQTWYSMFSDGWVVWDDHIYHIAHEYGHAVGQHHTYDSEVRCISHFDFLDDVFGLCSEPTCNCSAPSNCNSGHVCYLTAQCFWNSQTQPFPLMSGFNNSRYISPKSAGRMHRALSLYENSFVVNNRPMNKYVKEKYSYLVPLTITENEVWDFAIKLYQDVVIEPGVSLTITCDVKMPIASKIIIKPGATLVVDGGIITSAHDQPWQGIEVWGNSSAHQWPDANGNYQQGRLVLDNATIENAIVAVNLWKPDDLSKTGGVLLATNSSFINNTRSVHALLYTNFHPVTYEEMPYNALISNCKFEINNAYPGYETFYKHVDLNQVNGVRFRGCDFGLSPDAVNVSESNMGIGSYGSGFRVTALCESSSEPCTEWDSTTFNGFTYGIYATKDLVGKNTFEVNTTAFNNNIYGINSLGVTYFSVLNSSFKIWNNANEAGPCQLGGGVCSGFGINMIESFGYTIEENYFAKASGAPTGYYTGIRCKDGKAEHDLIYKNTFNGLSYGNFAEGNNRYSSDDFHGLEFRCNTNISNNRDFIVTGNDPYNPVQIRTFQGTLNKEAGNTFSTGVQLPDGHFKNTGTQVINYFYNTNPPVYYTQNYVIPIYVSGANNCPSHNAGSNDETVLSPEEKQLAELEFASNLADFNNVKTLYNNLKDGGNTEALKAEVETAWPDEMWELRADLLGKSPHLSKEVLMAAADKTEVLPESVLFEILSANPDELRKDELISYLENKEQPLPEYLISILRQLAGGITYKTILLQDMADYQAGKTQAANALIRSCLNDSIIDQTYLRSWLDNLDNLNADMQIVSSYMAGKDYISAQTMLDLIPVTRELAGNELDEYNNYKTLIEMQIALSQQSRSIFELDSTELALIIGFAENSSGKASLLSRNLLEYAYGHHYANCLPVDDTAAWKSTEAIPGSKEIDNGLLITAAPNPASSWVAFDYTLPVQVEEAVLQITDAQGRNVISFALKTKQGQQLWDIREVKKGTYFYNLKANGQSKSGKLIIN